MTKYTKEQIQNAKDMLNKFLTPEMTIYTKVLSVSSSGMSRKISLFIVHNGEIMNITFWVAVVLGWKKNDYHELTVSGCGMDMCFHTVYELAAVLYGDGYKLNKRNL